jgi:hypothetical protein
MHPRGFVRLWGEQESQVTRTITCQGDFTRLGGNRSSQLALRLDGANGRLLALSDGMDEQVSLSFQGRF